MSEFQLFMSKCYPPFPLALKLSLRSWEVRYEDSFTLPPPPRNAQHGVGRVRRELQQGWSPGVGSPALPPPWGLEGSNCLRCVCYSGGRTVLQTAGRPRLQRENCRYTASLEAYKKLRVLTSSTVFLHNPEPSNFSFQRPSTGDSKLCPRKLSLLCHTALLLFILSWFRGTRFPAGVLLRMQGSELQERGSARCGSP